MILKKPRTIRCGVAPAKTSGIRNLLWEDRLTPKPPSQPNGGFYLLLQRRYFVRAYSAGVIGNLLLILPLLRLEAETIRRRFIPTHIVWLGKWVMLNLPLSIHPVRDRGGFVRLRPYRRPWNWPCTFPHLRRANPPRSVAPVLLKPLTVSVSHFLHVNHRHGRSPPRCAFTFFLSGSLSKLAPLRKSICYLEQKSIFCSSRLARGGKVNKSISR